MNNNNNKRQIMQSNHKYANLKYNINNQYCQITEQQLRIYDVPRKKTKKKQNIMEKSYNITTRLRRTIGGKQDYLRVIYECYLVCIE